MEKKKGYIPLHERIQDADKTNKKILEDMETKKLDLNEMFKEVFDTDAGQIVLAHMVDSRVGSVPPPNANPNEIMYAHGAASVVHDILKRIR